MLRFSGCALIILFALTAPASAEKISFRPSGGLETAVDWSDASVQQAVISAAPTDWHDTPGADVWWVTLEGQRVHVQVFPALERPGAGEPSCCLHFVLGDTEFWLKVRAVSSQPPPAQGTAEQTTSHSSKRNGHAPRAALESLKPVTLWPDGAPGDPLVGDEEMFLDLAFPGDPLNASRSGGGSSEAERPESEGGSSESQFVLAQVPEPGLLVLMGLGAAAAVRRGRMRGRTIR